MVEASSYPHIQFDDGIPRVGESRYKVLHLAGEHYCYGWTAEEILRQHTDLPPEEAYAALGYFYDHFEEMVGQIKEQGIMTNEARSGSPQPSRGELLNRRKG